MTAKQKANRERFKKVVAEAKKLRKKNPKLTQPQAVKQAWAIMYSKKKVGATKIIQKGESKNAKVTKVLEQTRTKKGLFKGYKRIAGNTHKDTKSHNVNIRVVSGLPLIKQSDFDRTLLQYKKLVQEVKEAEKNYKNSKDSLNKFYNKQKLDKLKYELRERKFVITNIMKELKKIK